MPASASAATSWGRVDGFSLMQARAEVSRYSAMPPSRDSPGNAAFSQCMSSPARQAWQNPSVTRGCRITVSPGCTLVTPEPTSCTQPAFSWPRMYGSGVCILGHENAGWVHEVGSGVTNVQPGDTVILHPLVSEGFCHACRAGDDMHCENAAFPGLSRDGGMAEYLLTSARSCIKLNPSTR